MRYVVDFFAVLGGILCLYECFVAVRTLIRGWRRLSWDAIQKATAKLHDNIVAKKFDPDLIVGLGRGGAIAAGLLAARFRERKAIRLVPQDFGVCPVRHICVPRGL